MSYFTNEFINFFKGLSNNNNREWFNENKVIYTKHVKEPFEHFVEDLIQRTSMINPFLAITPKEAIFRIYRDVRFSKDKRPYKEHASAVITPGGRKEMILPGYYVELNHKGVGVYGGVYWPDAKQLQAIREHIAANLELFKKLINDKKFKSRFGEIQGEKNKRIPNEFEEAYKKQPLLINKQFYYHAKLDTKEILNSKLSDKLIQYFESAKHVNEFIAQALLAKGYK